MLGPLSRNISIITRTIGHNIKLTHKSPRSGFLHATCLSSVVSIGRQLSTTNLCYHDSSDTFRDREQPDQLPVRRLSAEDIIKAEFPEFFRDGKFYNRQTEIDFSDKVLARLEDLGIEKDLEAYKFLLKLFATGKFRPKSAYDFGLFSAPQQLCAVRILDEADKRGVIPDRQTQKIVEDGFSIHSKVWLKICRMNYWFMKGRHIDPHPLPETIPENPADIAQVALARLSDDFNCVITKTNTSLAPDAIDQTWLVYLTSPAQRSIIDRLDTKSTIYIEEAGSIYVKKNSLAYFTMRIYDSEDEAKRRLETVPNPKAVPNYNTLKVQFYGKPISEKLREPEERYRLDNSYVLGMAITGTSSGDSILSWVKLLQRDCPNLANLNVFFRSTKTISEAPKAEDNVQDQPRDGASSHS